MSVDVWMDMPKEGSVKQRFFFFLRGIIISLVERLNELKAKVFNRICNLGIFQSGPYYPFVFSLLTNVDEHLWNWTSVEAG